MTANRPSASSAYVVRDATPDDLAALEACYDRADHRRRIQSADGRTFRYLVVEADGQVAGFGRLVLAHPPGKPRVDYLPRISNLNVRNEMRGRGLGTALVAAMERIAAGLGHAVIYIGVSPRNPRAWSLYRRLGYGAIEDPAGGTEFVDSAGVRRIHAVYLAKRLTRPAVGGPSGSTPPG